MAEWPNVVDGVMRKRDGSVVLDNGGYGISTARIA